jgi:Na+-transporting NADH:ubiquinone oxidoreductase subunit F
MILALSTGGTILYSIIVFLIVILVLVGILLFARDKLAPKGHVTLNINDREIVVAPGSNLLSTLSGNEILMPDH